MSNFWGTPPSDRWNLRDVFGPYCVSTVETMVFHEDHGWTELDCERYASQEAAEKGHGRMVALWKKKADEEEQQ